MEFSLLNERGIEVFNTCKAFLEEAGAWKEIDVFLLEMYAFNVQEYEKLARDINREGSVIRYRNRAGFTNDIVNPKVTAYQQLCSLSTKLANSYGLTPLARKRLNLKATGQKKKGFNLRPDLDDE
ncbi:MAG: P27 family phage terminase small subunit [Cyclobacteriaceae bacterium]